MCDRIGILNKGKLVALDSTQKLLDKIQFKKAKFILDKNVFVKNNDLDSLKIISNIKNELFISYEKSKINIDQIINFINKKNVKILDISTDDGDLEDVFVALTKN